MKKLNKIGNGVNGKYMENRNYEIKHIDKLEDLDDFNWEYKGKKFEFKRFGATSQRVDMLNYISDTGMNTKKHEMLWVSEKNLSELELFGLKVIINEKPKITKEDKAFLKAMPGEFYIARDKNGMLGLYGEEPCMASESWISDIDDDTFSFSIDEEYLKFITCESERYWTIEELMELEVVDKHG